jgi:NitT/TauT family transport system substrate-binding protein
MSPMHRAAARAASMFLLVMVIAGCHSSSDRSIRIGINAWPGYEFLYLAQEMGYFRAEGVDVRIVEFASLSDGRRALERGQVDGLGTTLVELVQAHAHGKRSLQAVWVIDTSEGADVIVSQLQFPSMAALRGRKIGVELGSLGVFIAARALQSAGLALEDVSLVSTDQLTGAESFERGELDALVSYPPTSIRLVKDARAQVVFDSRMIPGEVVDVLVVDREKLSEPDIRAVLRGLERAFEYARQNRQDAYALMAAREGISPQEFAQALEQDMRMLSRQEQAPYFGPTGRLLEVIAGVDQVMLDTGQIKAATDPASMVPSRPLLP